MTASNSARLLAALLVVLPCVASADPGPAPPTEDQVEAGRELYKQARDLEREGKMKEALDRSLEAYRIAPTPVTAVLTSLLLAHVGRLVEARETARAVGGMPASPRETDKGREARQQAAAVAASLDARIPKIAVAGQPAGAIVLLDGKAMNASDPGAWRGVDPGVHALVVRVGERTCTSVHLTLGEGEERTIDLHDVGAACQGEPTPLPQLDRPAAATSKLAPPPPSQLPPAPPPADEGGGSPWRIAGIAVGATGLVAVGVGTVLAISAKHQYDQVAAECPPAGCNQDGFDTRTSARSQGDVATAVVGLGAAVVVGGVLMVWLAPKAHTGQVSVGVGSVAVRF